MWVGKASILYVQCIITHFVDKMLQPLHLLNIVYSPCLDTGLVYVFHFMWPPSTRWGKALCLAKIIFMNIACTSVDNIGTLDSIELALDLAMLISL